MQDGDDAALLDYAGATPEATVPASSFCTNCGSQIMAGKPFCGKCGQKIERWDQQAEQRLPKSVSTPSESRRGSARGLMDDKAKLATLSCLGLGLILGIVGAASET